MSVTRACEQLPGGEPLENPLYTEGVIQYVQKPCGGEALASQQIHLYKTSGSTTHHCAFCFPFSWKINSLCILLSWKMNSWSQWLTAQNSIQVQLPSTFCTGTGGCDTMVDNENMMSRVCRDRSACKCSALHQSILKNTFLKLIRNRYTWTVFY